MRLPGFNYSQAGYYFITICTYKQQDLFGEVIDDQMVLNPMGELVKQEWQGLVAHYKGLILDEYIIMPNHLHAIVIINDEGTNSVIKQGLFEIIRGFKTWSARKVNGRFARPGVPLWQRSFYDHIIRDETDLNNTREYILNNPVKWALSREP